jgi:2-polyprenyl-3-methyl-5-hydroxy-6-metoxy-1,4-benzoquinol methylase
VKSSLTIGSLRGAASGDELPAEIASPIASAHRALLIRRLGLRSVARQYLNRYGIDIYAHMQTPAPRQAGLYRCSQTGYEFFYPFELAGLSTLYEQLQRYPWYYSPWKWEHELASSLLQTGDRVLEVGCGVGHFLKRVGERSGIACIGLESNAKATAARVFDDVRAESIQVFASVHPRSMDVVCVFQVLEHVCDVGAFLTACCEVLKPGGRLFISVPNNDSDIQYDQRNVLNMPPHHMGLWRCESLSSLVNQFPLVLETMRTEPVSDSAVEWHTTLRHAKSLGYLPALALSKLRHFGLGKRFVAETVRLRDITPSHTIACVYRRDAQRLPVRSVAP